MGYGECPGNKGIIMGIVLTFHPVRPNPVKVVLDGTGVQESSGVKDHTRPQQLQGFPNFQRLSEALKAGQQRNRINKSTGSSKRTD
jgi:hypothetical protein